MEVEEAVDASTGFTAPNPAARAIDGRAERRAVRLAGHLLLAGGFTHDVTVADLSYEGCGIETSAPLTPGQAVKLSVLRRGAIDAEQYRSLARLNHLSGLRLPLEGALRQAQRGPEQGRGAGSHECDWWLSASAGRNLRQ